MKQSTTHKRMLLIFGFMAILYLALMLNLSYFELVGKKRIMSSSYNRRLIAYENAVLRGNIYDRNGTLLAESTPDSSVRNYPFNRLYSHVIGYSNERYGKSLLEAQYNDYLLGRDGADMLDRFISSIKNEPLIGSDLHLTIDHQLQTKARDLLGKKNGAIVAIHPKTGEILAMVSTPDFNPNEKNLSEAWSKLIINAESPLLPRATMGQYPPGSTFKLLTAIAALEQELGDFQYDDQGTITIDGKAFANANNKAYGLISLESALSFSSNTYFAALSEKIDFKGLQKLAFKAGIPFDASIASQTERAATALGQGQLLVTPLQMAQIAAWIGNNGIMMKPILVSDIEKAKVVGTLTSPEIATEIKAMMTTAVASGTGKNAKVHGVAVAGKTGTAQNEGEDHAWFIGFAPAEAPVIAVAVILEYEGQGGGAAAAPIAREIFKMAIK